MIKIKGIQKLTLLDYPGIVACTIFLGGCNFRCPFCHNYELVESNDSEELDEEEVLYFLKSRSKLLSGVVISGGEPTIHDELNGLLRSIKDLGFLVKLDTNGTRPEKIKELIGEGLIDYISMDIKNSFSKYPLTTNVKGDYEDVIKESIRIIKDSRLPHEFRTTVVRELHDEDDFYEIKKMIGDDENYYLQSFVDRETVPYKNLHAPTYEELKKYSRIVDGKIRGDC